MASFGKVLDLLDDRYLELQDVVGNAEPLPTLVPYEEYAQNVLVYRMDTDHEIVMGLIQDFTFRLAHQTHKELWTWLVQWEVDKTPPVQQAQSPKKVRLDEEQPTAPRPAPALTIFERRTLDGALLLEDDMLRILLDIVQVGSALVPNFIEFLYRWIDYHEGDGKALKAALRWEIPSLWDFDYHPLVLPPKEGEKTQNTGGQQGEGERSVSDSEAAELQQSSPSKMYGRQKPDLAAIERRTFYTEESERLLYREVKFGMQPPKVHQPLPPLINVPHEYRKRTKYYAACFRSRQRALFLLLEAGLTMNQVNNYQKLQAEHPKETPDTSTGNGLRNYEKDAKYAQRHFEWREKQIKQREIAISNNLAVEAQLAASHAIPDGAAGLPLIPPTPSYTRKTDMMAAMLRKLKEKRANKEERIKIVPKSLVGRMKSSVFENTEEEPSFLYQSSIGSSPILGPRLQPFLPQSDDGNEDMDVESETKGNAESEAGDEDATTEQASAASLPRPLLPPPLPPPPFTIASNPSPNTSDSNGLVGQPVDDFDSPSAPDPSTTSNIVRYIQNLTVEQAQRLIPLLQQVAVNRLQQDLQAQETSSSDLSQLDDGPSSSVQTGSMTDPYLLTSLPGALPAPYPTSSGFSEELELPRNATIPQTIVPGSSISMPAPSHSQELQPSPTPPLGTMLPPPRPGIVRNAPTPLSLSPSKPSPFSTLGPEILATSPFRAASSPARTPIQIYLPKILVPGNGIGPGGAKMGNGGCTETDALLLGHEDAQTRRLILSKAILLPVGVWENTLRKLRSDHWTILETYPCPSSRTAGGKGKEKAVDTMGKECHRAVYDKLAYAYGMMRGAPKIREDELTKRWRVSPGPMTSRDRGAVWEGWGVYVDREIEMSAAERADALKLAVDTPGMGEIDGTEDPDGRAYETERRRKEVNELLDEDEEMTD